MINWGRSLVDSPPIFKFVFYLRGHIRNVLLPILPKRFNFLPFDFYSAISDLLQLVKLVLMRFELVVLNVLKDKALGNSFGLLLRKDMLWTERQESKFVVFFLWDFGYSYFFVGPFVVYG